LLNDVRFVVEVDVSPESSGELVLVDAAVRVRVDLGEGGEREGEAVEGAREADVSQQRRHLQVLLVLSVDTKHNRSV